MQSISPIYQDKYPGVDPDFIDTVNDLIKIQRTGTINFFDPEFQLNGYTGKICGINHEPNGSFVELAANDTFLIRLDKIVTIAGKPGPAYEVYDRFGNACLTCEDLNQF